MCKAYLPPFMSFYAFYGKKNETCQARIHFSTNLSKK
jgi:hypothetical protein